MRDGFIKVAAASVDTVVADVRANVESIKKRIAQADALGVNLLVFPELCVTAYSCGDLFFSEALLAAAEMAPERGRKIVSVLLYCNLPWEADIESLDAICSAIQRTIPEDADIVFGCEFGEECSFLLATSEGKCGSKPFDAAHDRSVMEERYEG